MISLEANNQLLEIDRSNLRFNITYRSPYFGYLTSFVFNFLIPNTGHNSRVLNFPLRLNRINKTRVSMPGRILSDGIELASGTWEAASAGEDFIELSFTFIADELVAALKSKTLPDIFDEEVVPEDMIAHVEATVLQTWPETDHQFPSIYAPDFYGGENEAFLGVINNFEGSFVNDDFNLNTIVPQLYLFSIIKGIFEFANYEVSGDIFEDEMLKKALVLNNHALDRLIALYFKGVVEFFLTTSPKDFIIVWHDYLDEGGNYNAVSGKYIAPSAGNYEIIAQIFHIENVSENGNYKLDVVYKVGGIETILHTLTGTYGGFFVTSNINITSTLSAASGELFVRLKKTSGSNLEVNVLAAEITFGNSEILKANSYQRSFNKKNHVPVVDAIEFLGMFFEEYQIFPIIKQVDKNVRLINFSDILSTKPVMDLTQGMLRNSVKIKQNDYQGLIIKFNFDYDTIFIPDRIDFDVNTYYDLPVDLIGHFVYFINSLNAYYVRSYNESEDEWYWEFLADKNEIHEDGSKQKTIQLNFAPLLMRNVSNRLDVPRSLPFFDGSGTSHAYKQNNEFPLRIMFYVGYNDSLTDNPNKYPFASSSKLNSEGDEVLPYNYNASEVATRFYTKTIHWLKNRLEVEFERRFTSLELKQLSMGNQQMLLDSYIILEEIFANVDPDLSKAKIKGWVTG